MPFFQLCSTGGESPATEEATATEELAETEEITETDEESITNNSYPPFKTDTNDLAKEVNTQGQNPSTNQYEKFLSELFSPLIVTDNFTLSGAGMIYVFLASTIESTIPPIHPIFILPLISLSFLVLATIKTHKRKINQALRYSTYLITTNLLLFITAIVYLDNFTDIRWGFYLFLFSSFLIMKFLRTKASEFSNE